MMNRGRVIRGRVEYQVEYRVDYQILGEFFSKKVEFLIKKVEFLLESGEKKIKNGSLLNIYLTMTHKWLKTQYLGPIRLDSTRLLFAIII